MSGRVLCEEAVQLTDCLKLSRAPGLTKRMADFAPKQTILTWSMPIISAIRIARMSRVPRLRCVFGADMAEAHVLQSIFLTLHADLQTFIDVPPGDERALLSAIAMQPISVAIEGSSFTFQFYKSGVLADDSCGRNGNIDHGVLAVGYGTDLDTQEPYFLVKNSWGPEWGDAGFVKIGRKTENEFGICSILKMASFPIVE